MLLDNNEPLKTNIQNILIYIDDAVRYDTFTEIAPILGPQYKTVAASTHTPTSFGSILTGLYPPLNGVLSFQHSPAPNVESIFDMGELNTSIAARGGMNDTIASIFGDPPRTTIEQVEPPFIHVVRRPGGHAPYDGFDMSKYEYEDETAREYLYMVADDFEKARRDYTEGVKTSFEEFLNVLNAIEKRGLAEETLIIYTSDHGEVLGEYGFFGHTHLATPEVVYVPTVFIHPELEKSKQERLFHHVDIVPSIEEICGVHINSGRTNGIPFGKGRTKGYNHFEHVQYTEVHPQLQRFTQFFTGRTIQSLWGRSGGHVFTDASHIKSAVTYLGLLSQSPEGKQIYHSGDILNMLFQYTPGHQIFGSPQFGRDEAREIIAELLEEIPDQREEQLDEETVEHLRDMGYI